MMIIDRENNAHNKILLIDKPSGITSFDVIRYLRKKMNIRKIGHAGTLDPLASGLLVIGYEEGTKVLAEIIGMDKEYEAVIRLGMQTTTADSDGELIKEEEIGSVPVENIHSALHKLLGEHILAVPVYSATKQGGEPLYKKVRRGDKVIVPRRAMIVYSYELLSYTHPDVTVRFSVASGTYIRSLAEALGANLGTVAALTALRRTKIGQYCVEEAQTVDER